MALRALSLKRKLIGFGLAIVIQPMIKFVKFRFEILDCDSLFVGGIEPYTTDNQHDQIGTGIEKRAAGPAFDCGCVGYGVRVGHFDLLSITVSPQRYKSNRVEIENSGSPTG
jgi:hypothetical protein